MQLDTLVGSPLDDRARKLEAGPPAELAMANTARIVPRWDVHGSGHLDNPEISVMRRDLWRVLQSGVTVLGLPRTECSPGECRDGVQLVLLADAVTPLNVLGPFAAVVADRLRTHREEAWTRLRLAVHFGFLDMTGEAWSLQPLVHAARIVDAADVERLLDSARSTSLAVMISVDLHWHVIGQDHPRLPLADYQRVRVVEKDTITDAWVRLT